MKFILIAAVALLALAQGSFAQEATDMEKLTKYIEEMKTKFTEIVGNPELVNQAHPWKLNCAPKTKAKVLPNIHPLKSYLHLMAGLKIEAEDLQLKMGFRGF
ncbi:type-4 ice-structuring protein-like [Xyrichtys novacula]|nr:type-4 ice-structuring protein-like [Xyrichtys novacula]